MQCYIKPRVRKCATQCNAIQYDFFWVKKLSASGGLCRRPSR